MPQSAICRNCRFLFPMFAWTITTPVLRRFLYAVSVPIPLTRVLKAPWGWFKTSCLWGGPVILPKACLMSVALKCYAAHRARCLVRIPCQVFSTYSAVPSPRRSAPTPSCAQASLVNSESRWVQGAWSTIGSAFVLPRWIPSATANCIISLAGATKRPQSRMLSA